MDDFPKGHCAKMNASNEIEIRNWFARFAVRADDRYVAKRVVKGERKTERQKRRVKQRQGEKRAMRERERERDERR